MADKYLTRWRLGRLRRRRGGGRAGGSSELRRPNHVLRRAREGGVVGPEPRGQARSVMLATAVAAAAEEDDGAVGIIWCGAVVGEERSPLGRGPSEPPDSKTGHKRRQPVSSWTISRKNRTHNRLLSYGHTGRLTPS